jgi:hypothetical protein
MRLFTICVFIFTLLSTFTFPNSHSWGWSWKDLKIGITTENELLKNGGSPKEVTLYYHDYIKLKEGKPYSVTFRYDDSKKSRDSARKLADYKDLGGEIFEKFFYDPSSVPILEKAPLQLSTEVIKTEFEAHFVRNRLAGYSYTFHLDNSENITPIDIAKYVEIFNTLLGRPISMTNMRWIEYQGCYRLEIEPSRPYGERIWLRCEPGK